MRLRYSLIAITALLGACGAPQPSSQSDSAVADPSMPSPSSYEIVAEHRLQHSADDDLLTAGLGHQGLLADPPDTQQPPSASDLRRLAIYHGWRSVAHLSGPAGAVQLLGDLPPVSGSETSALLRLNGAQHPFRVVVQIPEDFDAERGCLVVAPASGSRGVWGAVALAGPWALPRGCAVAYTDKALGTDIVFLDTATGVALDGQRVALSEPNLAFNPETEQDNGVALKHAHSGDNPEADWGHHVLATAHYARKQLAESKTDSLSVIAIGLSNSGGAVLRAAEADQDGILDAVIAISPNITPAEQAPLFDYATIAALYQPCLLANSETSASMTLANPMLAGIGKARCESLAAQGLIEEPTVEAARQSLNNYGFDDNALSQTPVNVGLDLWRSVAVTYASAYLQRGAGEMPCGYAFDASGVDPQQRQRIWANHSGIAPAGGITLIDTLAAGNDAALPGLLCLRELWEGDSEASLSLRENIERSRATAELANIPVLLMHGREDGLIPAALSSRPYAEQAQANGAHVSYLEISPAQHFDTLLGAPGISQQFIPLLPYAWLGLDHITDVLNGNTELIDDQKIQATPPGAGETLSEQHLAWPAK